MLAKESRVTGKQAEWQELGAELNARRLVGRTIPGALRARLRQGYGEVSP